MPIITKIGKNIQKIKYKDDKIGYIYIENLKLKENLYNEDSYLNNVDRNVTVIKGSEDPKEKNTMLIIAAHSGTGSKAYFRNLDKLQIGNDILINYNNHEYTYTIKDIWNDKKNGTIKVPKENINQLILTTCSPNKKNYQLIINCTLKE